MAQTIYRLALENLGSIKGRGEWGISFPIPHLQLAIWGPRLMGCRKYECSENILHPASRHYVLDTR
jgi:hypothetical protein